MAATRAIELYFNYFGDVVSFREEHRAWWDAAVYTTGVAFSVIALLGITCSVLVLCSRDYANKRTYYVTLCALVTVIGASKGTVFMIDAYNLDLTYPPWLFLVSMEVSLPCQNAVFYLLWSTVYKATKMRRVGAQLFRPWGIILFVSCNFILSVGATLVTGFVSSAPWAIMVCAVYNVSVGFVFSTGFLAVFVRLHHVDLLRKGILNIADRHRQAVYTIGTGDQKKLNTTKVKSRSVGPRRPRVSPAMKLTVLCAVIFVCNATLALHAVVCAHVYQRDDPMDTWVWFLTQNLWRVCEVCLAATVLAFIALPVYKQRFNGKTKAIPIALKKPGVSGDS